MIRRTIACGCIVEIPTYSIIYCTVHKGTINHHLYRLAQMVCTWDGDAITYVEILRTAFPLVKEILENPDIPLNNYETLEKNHTNAESSKHGESNQRT